VDFSPWKTADLQKKIQEITDLFLNEKSSYDQQNSLFAEDTKKFHLEIGQKKKQVDETLTKWNDLKKILKEINLNLLKVREEIKNIPLRKQKILEFKTNIPIHFLEIHDQNFKKKLSDLEKQLSEKEWECSEIKLQYEKENQSLAELQKQWELKLHDYKIKIQTEKKRYRELEKEKTDIEAALKRAYLEIGKDVEEKGLFDVEFLGYKKILNTLNSQMKQVSDEIESSRIILKELTFDRSIALVFVLFLFSSIVLYLAIEVFPNQLY
jgi:hypothetical protein